MVNNYQTQLTYVLSIFYPSKPNYVRGLVIYSHVGKHFHDCIIALIRFLCEFYFIPKYDDKWQVCQFLFFVFLFLFVMVVFIYQKCFEKRKDINVFMFVI